MDDLGLPPWPWNPPWMFCPGVSSKASTISVLLRTTASASGDQVVPLPRRSRSLTAQRPPTRQSSRTSATSLLQTPYIKGVQQWLSNRKCWQLMGNDGKMMGKWWGNDGKWFKQWKNNEEWWKKKAKNSGGTVEIRWDRMRKYILQNSKLWVQLNYLNAKQCSCFLKTVSPDKLNVLKWSSRTSMWSCVHRSGNGDILARMSPPPLRHDIDGFLAAP